MLLTEQFSNWTRHQMNILIGAFKSYTRDTCWKVSRLHRIISLGLGIAFQVKKITKMMFLKSVSEKSEKITW